LNFFQNFRNIRYVKYYISVKYIKYKKHLNLKKKFPPGKWIDNLKIKILVIFLKTSKNLEKILFWQKNKKKNGIKKYVDLCGKWVIRLEKKENEKKNRKKKGWEIYTSVSNNTVDSSYVILFVNHHNKFIFLKSLVTYILIAFPDRV
jgi:hypothetical protein